jgi:hypothetical protein
MKENLIIEPKNKDNNEKHAAEAVECHLSSKFRVFCLQIEVLSILVSFTDVQIADF